MYNKTLNAIFLFLVLLISCNTPSSYKVKGKLKNSSGEYLYLKELAIADVINVDSVKVKEDGSFVLKGKNTKPAFYSLSISKNNYITLVIYPGDKIYIEADAKDLRKDYKIEGSDESAWVKELTENLNVAIRQVDSIGKVYQDSLGSPHILELKHRLDSLFDLTEKRQIDYTREFIKKHEGSLVTVMALYQQITPRRALLSPMLHYDLFKRVDSVMMLRYPDADAVKSLHSLISNITEEQIKQAELEKRTAIGAKAPEIALPSFDGNVITLSSLRGKYVLLNFWASWNNESRILNKSLVGIYWRYKNAGFDIYQVSLDKNRDAWLTAISSDGLAWHNVTDFKMWDSPIVPLYGIKNIPFSVLIDKEGKIIAKGNDIEIIKNKLFEIFKY